MSMVHMCCQKQTVKSLLVFDLSSPLFVYSTEKIMYHLKLQHTVCTTWNYNIRFGPPETTTYGLYHLKLQHTVWTTWNYNIRFVPPETTTYGLWGFKLMSSSSERLSIEQWIYVDCNTVHFLLPSFLYVHFYLILHFYSWYLPMWKSK